MKLDETKLYATIGKRLRHLRQEAKMTQSQLAENTGILRTSITNIESGKQKPPLSTLYKMCLVLNVEISDLLPSCSDTKSKEVPVEIGGRVDQVPPKSAEFLKRLIQS